MGLTLSFFLPTYPYTLRAGVIAAYIAAEGLVLSHPAACSQLNLLCLLSFDIRRHVAPNKVVTALMKHLENHGKLA